MMHTLCTRTRTKQQATLLHAVQAASIGPQIDDDLVEAWSEDVEALIWSDGSTAKFGAQFPALTISFITPNSIDFAIGESVAGDIQLVSISIVLICVLAIAALFLRDRVFSRASLAACGILSVMLSVASGFGICLAIGIPFTSLSQARPICFPASASGPRA